MPDRLHVLQHRLDGLDLESDAERNGECRKEVLDTLNSKRERILREMEQRQPRAGEAIAGKTG